MDKIAERHGCKIAAVVNLAAYFDFTGEEHAVNYEALQNHLGELIHGKKQWKTLVMPNPLAKSGALLEEKSEPLVPDDF
jgi:hypothetical protein